MTVVRLLNLDLGKARNILIALGMAVAACAGVVTGYLLVYSDELPQISALEERKPSIVTCIFDGSGGMIGQYAREKRLIVSIDEIPKDLRHALIAVEDARFYEHPGLDARGILRALAVNARHLRLSQGGSTLTQQLAKLLFLTPERSLSRKVNEAILAMRIESRYSKDEILCHYCNQVFLGHNCYGVDAASRFYFGKPVRALNLAESALIAGLPQRPTAFSPVKHPEAARRRRDHVLDRMAARAYISAEQAARIQTVPVTLRVPDGPREGDAAYFVEEVRKTMTRRFGQRRLYTEGFEVHTTLDSRLQSAATRALEEGLRALDKRQGWRGVDRNVLDEGVDLRSYRDPSWRGDVRPGTIVRGIVTSVTAQEALVRIEDRTACCPIRGATWTGARRMNEILRAGDLVCVKVTGLDRKSGRLEAALDQEPRVEGALVALDVCTGRILAMCGGISFERSKFNCAVQAHRQPGSAFKPIYYAAALHQGLTAADTFFDEPIAIDDPHTHVVYVPRNYSRHYYGLTTLRRALEKSRNPVSVQILETIGYDAAIDFARRLGISAELRPYPSLALGAFETTLLEQTSAYQAFANQGVRCAPYAITEVRDREGRVVLRNHPRPRRVINEDTAFLVTHILQGVITRGTGVSARSLQLPLAGKTGTTDGCTDALFIGYSPRIVCGVWVGHREGKTPLGAEETGASAALPIWKAFMDAAVDRDDAGAFTRPANVDLVDIDPETGLRVSPWCTNVIREAFIRGTEPVAFCSEAMHALIALPYEQQRASLAAMPLTHHGLTPPLRAIDPETDEDHDLAEPPAGDVPSPALTLAMAGDGTRHD